ncbi:MAG: hypothetical protein EPO32_03180 [Anaerolineae bacterium]|nr:MAG: hypothetical protein EPO32_03180 [Anaerolineae bacterium]
MPRILSTIVIFAILLSACATPPGADATEPASPIDSSVLQPAELTATPDPAILRTAALDELEGVVETRSTETDSFKSAVRGDLLAPNAEVRTGEDGKARVKLDPEGTSIRLGPNSHLRLETLSPSAADAQTRLELFIGQVWVVLNGGSLDVDTASGLATVRGSMMSVGFDPILGDMTITCLEGLCSVGNAFGVTDLIAGQATNIPGAGQPPNPSRPMSPDELDQWRLEVPESGPAFEALSAEPAAPVPFYQPGGGPDAASTQPVTYTFNNLCYAVWHWEFEGPVNSQIDVAPDSTESGELPPGVYQVHDWDDSGFDNGWYEVVGGSNLDVTHDCPDPQSAPSGP